MKPPFKRALGGAALAFSLFLAPTPGAFAAIINITHTPSNLSNSICGNTSDPEGSCYDPNGDDGNIVTIGNGIDLGDASVRGRMHGSRTESTTGTGNQVIFGGKTTQDVSGATAFSWADGLNATATGNKVVFGATASAMMVTGGLTGVESNATAKATGNQVLVEGGKAMTISGGMSSCRGNCTAEASNNTVTISGHVSGFSILDIIGGIGDILGDIGDVGGTATIMVTAASASADAGGTAIARDNTVEILKGASFSGLLSLDGAGALVNDSFSLGTSTGSTLKLHISDLLARCLLFWQNMYFYVPASLGNGGTMIAVDGDAMLDGATIRVGIENGSTLKVGDRIILVDVSRGNTLDANAEFTTGAPNPNRNVISLTSGYSFSIVESELANKKLVVQVGAGGIVNPEPAVTATSSGDKYNLSLTCHFQPPENIQGKQKKIYVAGTLPDFSMFFFMNKNGGWEQYLGGDWPSHADEMMTTSPFNIPLANGLDVSSLVGFMILVGWGDNATDVVNSGQFAECYTIKN